MAGKQGEWHNPVPVRQTWYNNSHVERKCGTRMTKAGHFR